MRDMPETAEPSGRGYVDVPGRSPERPRGWRGRLVLLAVAVGIAAVLGLVVFMLSRSDSGQRPAPVDQTMVMPDIVGLSVEEATQTLKDSGFTDDPEIMHAADPSTQAGTVVAQEPAAGARLSANSDVTLTVSEGPAG